MDFHSEPVSCRITEILSVAFCGDVIPRQGVRFFSRHAGFNMQDTKRLGIVYDLINLFQFITWLSDRDGACDIRTIAFIISAEIERDQVSLFNQFAACHSVGRLDLTPEATIISKEEPSAPWRLI